MMTSSAVIFVFAFFTFTVTSANVTRFARAVHGGECLVIPIHKDVAPGLGRQTEDFCRISRRTRYDCDVYTTPLCFSLMVLVNGESTRTTWTEEKCVVRPTTRLLSPRQRQGRRLVPSKTCRRLLLDTVQPRAHHRVAWRCTQRDRKDVARVGARLRVVVTPQHHLACAVQAARDAIHLFAVDESPEM